MKRFADYVTEGRKKVTSAEAEATAKRLKINFAKEKFDLECLTKGMNVELEHEDVTHGDLVLTAKIALAHLKERPDYYEKLAKIEK